MLSPSHCPSCVGDQVCSGEFSLAKNLTAPKDGRHVRAKRVTLRCDWHVAWHYPIWGTPVIISLISVSCLLACYRKRSDLVRKTDAGGGRRAGKGAGGGLGRGSQRRQRVRMVDATELEGI